MKTLCKIILKSNLLDRATARNKNDKISVNVQKAKSEELYVLQMVQIIGNNKSGHESSSFPLKK